ncbi:MAG: LUD domain-containing protein [Planctomycetales bacterium]
MASREIILNAIAEHRVPPVELPGPFTDGIEYDDPFSQFQTVLKAVGGEAIRVPTMAAAQSAVSKLQIVTAAQRIFSSVPEVLPSGIDLSTMDDPRSLNQLDLAVLSGQLAVAENAAVWVTDAVVRHRVVYFIAEHLILVVPASRLFHNMHQAYTQLSFSGPQYGLFISGPSKTADIEQSLVIGAQGPRSLHVILVDDKQHDDG